MSHLQGDASGNADADCRPSTSDEWREVNAAGMVVDGANLQRQRGWTGPDFDQSVTDDANDYSAMEERRQADARCLDELQAEKRTRVGLEHRKHQGRVVSLEPRWWRANWRQRRCFRRRKKRRTIYGGDRSTGTDRREAREDPRDAEDLSGIRRKSTDSSRSVKGRFRLEVNGRVVHRGNGLFSLFSGHDVLRQDEEDEMNLAVNVGKEEPVFLLNFDPSLRLHFQGGKS